MKFLCHIFALRVPFHIMSRHAIRTHACLQVHYSRSIQEQSDTIHHFRTYRKCSDHASSRYSILVIVKYFDPPIVNNFFAVRHEFSCVCVCVYSLVGWMERERKSTYLCIQTPNLEAPFRWFQLNELSKERNISIPTSHVCTTPHRNSIEVDPKWAWFLKYYCWNYKWNWSDIPMADCMCAFVCVCVSRSLHEREKRYLLSHDTHTPHTLRNRFKSLVTLLLLQPRWTQFIHRYTQLKIIFKTRDVGILDVRTKRYALVRIFQSDHISSNHTHPLRWICLLPIETLTIW